MREINPRGRTMLSILGYAHDEVEIMREDAKENKKIAPVVVIINLFAEELNAESTLVIFLLLDMITGRQFRKVGHFVKYLMTYFDEEELSIFAVRLTALSERKK